MELKVSVEGVQRIVCGVTERTTCQEVVIALAQASGRTGRYTLREKFKEYERNVTPDERVLESLEKYGEQAREVQLILKHNGPSLWEEASRLRGSRYQACGQLRRVDRGSRIQQDSDAAARLYRQSLPPLSRTRIHSEPPPEEPKKTKRKSLTLMEEAWGWLENLGRGGKQQLGRDKGKGKDEDKGNGYASKISIKPAKDSSVPGALQGKDKKEKVKVTEHHNIISCLGNHGKDGDDNETGKKPSGKQNKGQKKDQEVTTSKKKSEPSAVETRSTETAKDEREEVRELLMRQQILLKDLQIKMDSTDDQICELEEQHRRVQSPDAAQDSAEEAEQLEYWMNELKAEEGYERDLQKQFFEMKEKAAECKAKLEEYKFKLNRLDLARNTTEEPGPNPRKDQKAKTLSSEALASPVYHCKADVQPHLTAQAQGPNGDSEERIFDSEDPYVFISPDQISDPQHCGPKELREWWSRWSEAQRTAKTKPKIIHRSEITIHLGSTRV